MSDEVPNPITPMERRSPFMTRSIDLKSKLSGCSCKNTKAAVWHLQLYCVWLLRRREYNINGYTDGTFCLPTALSGFAFSKMLLGALGYDGTVEGFISSGWTMNVASLGRKARLFDNFATAFKSGIGVTRQNACLLALI